MMKANLLAESRYLETKGVIKENELGTSGPQKTDPEIEELANDIINKSGGDISKEKQELKLYSKTFDDDTMRRLTNRVSKLKLNEQDEVSDDYFSKYNTTMQEQKEICWNMIQHFKSIDKAISENEKMMNDKIKRAEAARESGNIEEYNDYMESIKLFQFRIQYMNNNRDMLSASENPFFNK